MLIQQVKELIPAQPDTMFLQHRNKQVMQLARSQAWHPASKLMNMLQNNIFIKIFSMQALFIVINRASAFAKQCT